MKNWKNISTEDISLSSWPQPLQKMGMTQSTLYRSSVFSADVIWTLGPPYSSLEDKHKSNFKTLKL